MNAEQARKLRGEALAGPVINPLMDIIYVKIRTAAKAGKSSITHPFHDVRMLYPTFDTREAVWAELRRQGYKVTHHSDPDPGHPCSSAYDEISW